MAWGHRRASPDAFAIAAHYPYNRRHAASSTLHSNVDDMLRWARENLQRGDLDGVRILLVSSYDELWKEQYDMRRARVVGPVVERLGVGLSWFLETRRGTRYVSHSGGDAGFRSDLLLAPDNRVAVVVMTNSEAGPTQLSRALMDAVLADRASTKRN
jgi:CubicO group peptidase (beta-lactamase class C family)